MNVQELLIVVRRKLYLRKIREAASYSIAVLGGACLIAGVVAFLWFRLWPVVLALLVVCALAFAIWRRYFAAPSISDAAILLDERLSLKDRLSSLISLEAEVKQGRKEAKAKYEFIAAQLAPAFQNFNPATLNFTLTKMERRMFVSGAATLLCGILCIFVAHPSYSNPQAQALESLIEDQPALPEKVKEALHDLAQKIEERSLQDSEAIEAFERAQSEIEEAKESLVQSEQQQTVDTQPETFPTPEQGVSSSESPSPTPTPTPTSDQQKDQEKKEQQQQEKQQDKTKQQEQQQNRSESGKDNEGKEKDQGQEQQGDNKKKGEQSKGESKDKKKGEGEGEGEGDGKGQGQGQQSSEKEGEGKQAGKQDSAGKSGESKGDTSKSDQQQQQSKGDQKSKGEGQESKSKSEQEGQQGQGSKQGSQSQQSQALDKAQQKLDEIKKAQSPEQQKGSPQEQNSKQGKDGNKPEQAQQPGEKGAKPSDDKKTSKDDKSKGSEQSPSSKKDDKSEQSEVSEQSSKATKSGEAKEWNDQMGEEGKGLGDRAGFKEAQVEAKDEKYDTRFTEKKGERAIHKGEAKPKTELGDLKLAKPEIESQDENQPIPLEYKDLLQ